MAQDDVQSVAAALLTPHPDFVARLVRTRDAVAASSVEAARQLTAFLDRISDLSVDELGELHHETFNARLPAELGPVAVRLASRSMPAADAREALGVLTPALMRLDADRNPFAHVVRALCCLLLGHEKGVG